MKTLWTWGHEFEWFYPSELVKQVFEDCDVEAMFSSETRGHGPYFDSLGNSGVKEAQKNSKSQKRRISKVQVAHTIVDLSRSYSPDQAKEIWSKDAPGHALVEVLNGLFKAIRTARGH